MTHIDFRAVGAQAYQAGEPLAPALNGTIRNFIADRPVGDPETAQAMQDFMAGWMSANLADDEDQED
jgi:hypothetical protein